MKFRGAEPEQVDQKPEGVESTTGEALREVRRARPSAPEELEAGKEV